MPGSRRNELHKLGDHHTPGKGEAVTRAKPNTSTKKGTSKTGKKQGGGDVPAAENPLSQEIADVRREFATLIPADSTIALEFDRATLKDVVLANPEDVICGDEELLVRPVKDGEVRNWANRFYEERCWGSNQMAVSVAPDPAKGQTQLRVLDSQHRCPGARITNQMFISEGKDYRIVIKFLVLKHGLPPALYRMFARWMNDKQMLAQGNSLIDALWSVHRAVVALRAQRSAEGAGELTDQDLLHHVTRHFGSTTNCSSTPTLSQEALENNFQVYLPLTRRKKPNSTRFEPRGDFVLQNLVMWQGVDSGGLWEEALASIPRPTPVNASFLKGHKSLWPSPPHVSLPPDVTDEHMNAVMFLAYCAWLCGGDAWSQKQWMVAFGKATKRQFPSDTCDAINEFAEAQVIRLTNILGVTKAMEAAAIAAGVPPREVEVPLLACAVILAVQKEERLLPLPYPEEENAAMTELAYKKFRAVQEKCEKGLLARGFAHASPALLYQEPCMMLCLPGSKSLGEERLHAMRIEQLHQRQRGYVTARTKQAQDVEGILEHTTSVTDEIATVHKEAIALDEQDEQKEQEYKLLKVRWVEGHKSLATLKATTTTTTVTTTTTTTATASTATNPTATTPTTTTGTTTTTTTTSTTTTTTTSTTTTTTSTTTSTTTTTTTTSTTTTTTTTTSTTTTTTTTSTTTTTIMTLTGETITTAEAAIRATRADAYGRAEAITVEAKGHLAVLQGRQQQLHELVGELRKRVSTARFTGDQPCSVTPLTTEELNTLAAAYNIDDLFKQTVDCTQKMVDLNTRGNEILTAAEEKLQELQSLYEVAAGRDHHQPPDKWVLPLPTPPPSQRVVVEEAVAEELNAAEDALGMGQDSQEGPQALVADRVGDVRFADHLRNRRDVALWQEERLLTLGRKFHKEPPQKTLSEVPWGPNADFAKGMPQHADYIMVYKHHCLHTPRLHGNHFNRSTTSIRTSCQKFVRKR